MKNSTSNSTGVFTLCKAILGASLVTLPLVHKSLGIVLASVLITFFAVVNVYSLRFIMLAGKKTKTNNLTDLGGIVNKKMGKATVTILLFMTCVIPLIYYIKFTSDYFEQVLQFCGIKVSSKIVITLTSLICFVMCIIFQNVEKLKYVSIVGLGALSGLTFYIIYLFIKGFKSIKFENVKLFHLDFDSLDAVSNISFAFCSQFSILSITENIPRKKDCNRIIWTSNIISCLVYIITGSLGYMVSPYTDTNVLLSLDKNAIRSILQFALGVVNISTFPLIMIPTKFSLHYFVQKTTDKKPTVTISTLEVFAISFLIYIIAILIGDSLKYIDYLFFLAGSLVMFAMPSYFYIKTFKKDRDLVSMGFVYISFALTAFGMYMGFKGIYNSF